MALAKNTADGYKKVEQTEINFSSKVKVIFTFWCLLMHLEWLQYGNMGYTLMLIYDSRPYFWL